MFKGCLNMQDSDYYLSGISQTEELHKFKKSLVFFKLIEYVFNNKYFRFIILYISILVKTQYTFYVKVEC